MSKLLIVDGSNLLFQMFFGMPSRIINSNGKAIQGTLGFIGALLRIIRMTSPTHIVVLFDSEHKEARIELDHSYKANRPDYSDIPDDENPFSQLPDIYAALDFLSIKHTEVKECETDDSVASYALTYGNDIEIVISSFDSDFFQLISDNVSVLRYRGDNTVIYTSEHIKNKFGILPSLYADFKSLTGDSADNIKGAERIGKKTAAELVNAFGDIESIIKNADMIKKPSIRESIIKNSERLKTNYKLIKIQNDVPLPFLLPALEYLYSGVSTTEVLRVINLK